MMIEPRYDAISQDAKKLVGINQDEADSAVTEIQALQRRSLILLVAITLSLSLLAVFAAVRVTRLLKRQNDQIAQATRLLETRNRELDAFAGRVAHDLRGPLNTINLSTALLSEQALGNEATHAILRRAVSRMETLIGDLLTLSRIDTQTLGSVSQVSTVAQGLAEELGPQVKSVDGVLRIELEPAKVQGSEVLFQQALWNIGENAVKYRRSEVQLEIDIQGRDVGHSYEFRISDNGAGMTTEVASHAFEPFFRGEEVASTPGTGLGLSIVKRVIEASGGSVSVASEVGKGTTFIIKLPLGNGGR